MTEVRDQAKPRALGPLEQDTLQAGRILCAVMSALYLGFWFLDRAALHADPMEFRFAVAVALMGGLGASYVWPAVQRRLHVVLLGALGIITVHLFVLLIASGGRPAYALQALVVTAGFVVASANCMRRPIWVSGYLVLVLGLTAAALMMVSEPQVPFDQFAAAVIGLCLLSTLAINSQLRTLARLRESERLVLQEQQRRKNAEERAARLLSAIPEVLLVLDARGVVTSIHNDEGSTMGSLLRRALGTRLERCFSEAGPIALTEAIRLALSHGDVPVIDGRFSEQLGGAYHAEIRVAGTAHGSVLVLVRDVTQERVIQGQLQRTERLVALGTLASSVAHEINNPLSYVLANVDFASECLQDEGSKNESVHEIVRALGEARDGSERIRDIVTNLREQTHPGDGEVVAVDANGSVERAVTMVQGQVRHRTQLSIELGDVGAVRAHPVRLTQVIINLLLNATDALPERSQSENTIVVRTSDDGGDSVLVEVQDNGVGIPDALRCRIFDPFFTTKPEGVGTGLGLYLCHQFVTGFGGRIEVESEVGVGTRFCLHLPKSEERPSTQSPSRMIRIDAMQVLVLDDEPLISRAIARMLRGHEVITATTAQAALEECQQTSFDLVLCDLMMPSMNGVEFYRALEQLRPDLCEAVVFMSGGVSGDSTREFLTKHGNPCMEKPIDKEKLLKLMRARRRAQLQAEQPRSCGG